MTERDIFDKMLSFIVTRLADFYEESMIDAGLDRSTIRIVESGVKSRVRYELDHIDEVKLPVNETDLS